MTTRLYYSDCARLEFTARVVASGTRDGRPVVELDQTAFYPTSGGQPFDTGTLGEAHVVEVVDLDESILHVLSGPVPPVGADVVGRIDAERRLDHTQQHTGQHVLSQAFERTGGPRTVSFHLGAESCTIDLDSPRVLPEQVGAAEELANRIVLEDRPVRIHFAAVDDLERFGLRKPGPKGAPRTGTIRIVVVTDFDTSACGGTHVARTGQIGPIKVRRWERRGEVARVEFLCGWRALRDYAQRLATTRTLAERLSVKDSDLLVAASRALDELERQRDENLALREKALEREADELLAAAMPLGADRRLARRVFASRAPDELKRLALRLVTTPGVIALLGAAGDRSHVILAQSPGLPHDLSAILRQVGPPLGVRGGGTHDLAQGGGPPGASIDALFNTTDKVLRGEV